MKRKTTTSKTKRGRRRLHEIVRDEFGVILGPQLSHPRGVVRLLFSRDELKREMGWKIKEVQYDIRELEKKYCFETLLKLHSDFVRLTPFLGHFGYKIEKWDIRQDLENRIRKTREWKEFFRRLTQVDFSSPMIRAKSINYLLKSNEFKETKRKKGPYYGVEFAGGARTRRRGGKNIIELTYFNIVKYFGKAPFNIESFFSTNSQIILHTHPEGFDFSRGDKTHSEAMGIPSLMLGSINGKPRAKLYIPSTLIRGKLGPIPRAKRFRGKTIDVKII